MARFSKKIGIGPCRLSYARLTERNDMGKYSTVLLLPKTDKASYKLFMDACKEVYENSTDLQDYEFANICPIRDGNGTAAKGKKYPPEYSGMWVINASNKMQPLLRCKDINGVMGECEDPEQEFYSGAWAKAGLTLFPYSNQSTGIGVSLDLLRKTKDDECLGAVIRETDYFADDDEEDDI